MKTFLATILLLATPLAHASPFAAHLGLYRIVVAVGCDSKPCLDAGDLVAVESEGQIARLAFAKAEDPKRAVSAIAMRVYEFSEEGHYDFAKFRDCGQGACWEQSSNGSGQFVRLEPTTEAGLIHLTAEIRPNFFSGERYDLIAKKIR